MSNIGTLSNLSSPTNSEVRIDHQDCLKIIQQDPICNANAIAIHTMNNKTDTESSCCEPSNSFQPSILARTLSQFTAPRTLVTCGALGASVLFGASLPLAVGVAGIALAVQQIATKIVSGGDVLRSAVYMEAETLSIVSIKGGLPIITIPPMLEALRQMDSKDARIAVNCLENLLNYENNFNLLGISNTPLVNELIQHVINLKPGQKTALPFSYMNFKGGGHIMIGSIEKKEDEKFVVRFHNGGGLKNHFNKIESVTGNILYQTTLEVDDVEESNLIPFIQQMTSLNTFRANHDISNVYGLISLLKGNNLPPSSDSRLWTREQEGMSCSGYSLRCFLISILTPESFSEFEFKFLTLATTKLKDKIENGPFWNQTSEHRIAYYELRGRLIRMGGADPGELEKVPPSLLTNIASLAQTRFWSIFFSSFFKYEMDCTEFERIGLFYEEIHLSLRDMYKTDKSFHKCLGATIEEKKAAKNKLRDLLELFYRNIDRSLFSYEDLDRIDNNIKDDIHLNFAAQLIFKIFFSNLEYHPNDKVALMLLEAIDQLKKKEFHGVRKKLEDVYRQVELLQNIPLEIAKEYAYAMCKMLYFLNHPAEQLEDLELRAATTIIFAKLGGKATDRGKKYFKISEIFNRSLMEYRKHRLEKEFPNSPWSEDVYKKVT